MYKYDPDIGDKFTVKCASACREDLEDVFGYKIYASESYICAAAYHSGATGR